jgi:Glu-tRNA(Gln) amidotransferase subunit E-like FAD-binding protein
VHLAVKTVIGFFILISGIRAEERPLSRVQASYTIKIATDELFPVSFDDGILGKVGLTLAQRQHVRDLISKDEAVLLSPESDELEYLHQAITAKEFDKKALKSFLVRRMQKQIEREVAISQLKNRLYNLLNDKQKKIIDQLFEQQISMIKTFPTSG